MTATGRTVTLTRRIAAPPAQVFRYWTEPELLRTWYAPVDGWVVGEAVVTPGVGGGYRVTFGPAPEGDAYTEQGTYQVYDVAERLLWHGTVEGDGADDASLIEITFAADGEETLVTVVESGLDADTAAEHEEGWTAGLDKLAAAVEGAS